MFSLIESHTDSFCHKQVLLKRKRKQAGLRERWNVPFGYQTMCPRSGSSPHVSKGGVANDGVDWVVSLVALYGRALEALHGLVEPILGAEKR